MRILIELLLYNLHLFISVLVKAAVYKKGAGLIGSIFFGLVFTLFEEVMHVRFMGISILFFMAGFILVLGDLFTGIMAAMKEKGKNWLNKEKLIFSAFKLVFIMVLLLLAYAIHEAVLWEQKKVIENEFWYTVFGSAATTISVIRTVLFALVLGKEYISIGDNIEKTFGKKHYMFRIFEKLFDVIELKFLRRIENYQEKDKEEK